MKLQEIRDYCNSKAETKEDFPFDMETLVFKVVDKMFALTNIKSEELRINLKCDPTRAQLLRKEYKAIIPGFHMNKTHWNTVIIDGSLKKEFIFELIDHSYELVVKGLPKSKRPKVQHFKNSDQKQE